MHQRHRLPATRLLPAALALAMLLAGCGGGEEEDQVANQPATPPANAFTQASPTPAPPPSPEDPAFAVPAPANGEEDAPSQAANLSAGPTPTAADAP